MSARPPSRWFALLLLVTISAGAALAIAQNATPGAALRSLGGAPRSRPQPSRAIFPTQRIPLRFSHKTHVKDVGVRCNFCHAGAQTSMWASNDLLPPEAICRSCHAIDHDQPMQVTDPPARCDFCHVGWEPSAPRRVEVVQIPRPNVRFPHKVHVTDQQVPCERCHGAVDEQDMATRDNLPKMQTCFGCHNTPAGGVHPVGRGAAPRQPGSAAPQTCDTCHLTQRNGLMATRFPEGELTPPRWMRGANHDADWIFRHRNVAGEDSAFCGNCHEEQYCIDCHDGRVRNRTVHPNDWITTHPVSARRDDPSCQSCHRAQSFCLDCHRRTGVAQSDLGDRPSVRQFHAPEWMIEGPGHHRFDARRNLQTCVSCHAESDCIACHGALGIGAGGAGMFSNPSFHESGFAGGRCRSLKGRNPRPCLACHTRDDPHFLTCSP